MKRKSPRTESAASADAGEGGEIFAQEQPPHARIREETLDSPFEEAVIELAVGGRETEGDHHLKK